MELAEGAPRPNRAAGADGSWSKTRNLFVAERGRAAVFEQAIRDAVEAPGCAICLLVAEQAEQFLHWYSTETYNTPELVDDLDRGPFCREHARRIVVDMGMDIGGPLSSVIDRERRRVDQLRRHLRPWPWPVRTIQRWLIRREAIRPRHAAFVERLFARRGPCRACESERIMEDYAVHGLVRLLDNEEEWVRFAASDGLCREHMRQVLACAHPALALRLADDLRRRLDRLADRLKLMFHKLDYRHSAEPRGDEIHAWRDALEYHSGWIPPQIRPGAGSGNRYSTPLRGAAIRARRGEHAFRGAEPAAAPRARP
jgi:hypothetical protein